MATLQAIRLPSPVAGTLAVAVSAALLAGGAGGYLVRGLTWQASAPVHTAAVHSSQAHAVAQLPEWVQRYLVSAGTPRFRVDDMIESLSYAGTAGRLAQDELPGWVQRYTTPAVAPRFRVDDLIENLSYAGSTGTLAQDELPAWVKQYITPTPARPLYADPYRESRR